MKSYEDYEFEDFLADEEFQRWVRAGAPTGVTVWQRLIDDFPDKKTDLENAKEFIRSWQRQAVFSDAETEQGIQRVLASKQARQQTASRWFGSRWLGWRVAAATILLFGIGWTFWKVQQVDPMDSASDPAFTAQTLGDFKEITNTKTTSELVDLPDGSQIQLAPASQVRFSTRMTRLPSRNVFLTGEAFFTVTKNPQKPFMVYANGLVAQVVGTSFTVKAFEKIGQVTLVVHTGKVAVFPLTALKTAQQSQQRMAGMVLLTPNQQVTFDKASDQLTQSVVKNPALLRKPDNNQYFVFRNTPVSEVFQKLEESYGITISYDDKILKSCNLTVPLSDEPLFKKLDIICETIGATYEVWGTRIVITGKGCQPD